MAMIGIVPEVFKEENYEFWKICLKSYLVGQGLWDVVTREATSEEEEQSQEWQRKNAQALHAIQLACGSQAYGNYVKKTHVSAKIAWEHLAEVAHIPSQHSEVTHVSGDINIYENLYNAIEEDNIKKVSDILKEDPKAITACVSSHGDTALHVAILSGNMKIALGLVKKMPPEGLEIRNGFGDTPLSLAAVTESVELAAAMVERNPMLVTIRSGTSDQNSLPVIVASMYGRKPMVRYLYSTTPKHLLDPNNPDLNNGRDGVLLLNNLINAEIIDIATMLLRLFPKLGVMPDYHDEYALHKLAQKPSVFASGSILPFWKQWIYNCVHVHSLWKWNADTKETRRTIIDIHNEEEMDISDEEEFMISSQCHLLHQLCYILLRFLVPDIKSLHDRKVKNDGACDLLRCIFSEMKSVTAATLDSMDIDTASHSAFKHGIAEFHLELLKYNPDIIWRKDEYGRTIFSHAISFRQEKLFSLFYTLGAKKNVLATRHDVFGNNFLHLAAKLSPPAELERVSGAALQMQRDLVWYKAVESIVPTNYKDQMNVSLKKPRSLFSEEHKDLAKEGEIWMKNTAGSSMIVGTLIASVMFTSAFTIPGGNDDKSGLPTMLQTTRYDRIAFMLFTITNGLSLFASSASVLTFLGILTARYAEEDFLVSLPTKLIIGIACLFFSIVAMLISFVAAMFLMLNKTLFSVFIPLAILSTFPAVLFSAFQFPLLVEMIIRTYGSTKFDKRA